MLSSLPITPAVSLQGLHVRMGQTVALRHIDFDIGAGDRVAVVGESGAGKSTLLNVIAGLVRPTGGRVLLHGVDVAELSPDARSIGMVFQTDALFPHMTVFDNVAFPLSAKGRRASAIKARVEALLLDVGLRGEARRLPRELSGGQRQRVALARAMALAPSVLLLDEPFASLDVPLRRHLRELLLALHDSAGFTLVAVTHDPEEAAHLGERIAVLREGTLVTTGTIRSLYWQSPDAYVASLFGYCNFASGVIRMTGEGVLLSIFGRTIPYPGPSCDWLQPRDISLFVRPEAVRVLCGAESDLSVPARLPFEGVVMRIRESTRGWTLHIGVDGGKNVIVALVPYSDTPLSFAKGAPVRWDVDWQLVTWRVDGHVH